MNSPSATHPSIALFDPDEAQVVPLPVCDHYAGVEARMRKSLELQAQMGPVFDVTLDNEDGAPVGAEIEQAHLIGEMLASAANRHGRVGVRLLHVDHEKFEAVLDIVLRLAPRKATAGGGHPPAYLMCPKPRHLHDLQRAISAIDAASARHGHTDVPVHVLVETHGALQDVQAIAHHPRVQSVSFGLMDFVSAHRGAIPQSAMQLTSPGGQFDHPLVMRAKLEIAAACHAAGKTPSHCVVTEFNDIKAMQSAADVACRRLGYTRMWSIHPSQIKPIIDAFAPTPFEVDQAVEIISAAQAAAWAPIRVANQLHDRASYRYFWQLLQRAHQTSFVGGQQLPAPVRAAWFEPLPKPWTLGAGGLHPPKGS